mmetsp:Transcript_36346/g.85272  ORF Transcript_36346/g.85272 Transcript_36346/m.85272 type:complete len:263 (-) Transcript_36346:51-839(-)|eukprot:CAMPEP_0178448460 /NCGR_PEP_ID=MMETSP0689_2-20121128/42001_1 /TAXON_ID=160604 /ORGANISM="Amphidinium massartii, Strain CS-259" /LENGTH=262 /DNA_ID=CAMNT_0020073657 /DNA_START=60 /DNA_END=848 /DNA_ORIENTATION=-
MSANKVLVALVLNTALATSPSTSSSDTCQASASSLLQVQTAAYGKAAAVGDHGIHEDEDNESEEFLPIVEPSIESFTAANTQPMHLFADYRGTRTGEKVNATERRRESANSSWLAPEAPRLVHGAGWNVSSMLLNELEHELTAPEGQVKSKIVLALINAFALGMCGIDRCYMGQILIGLLKFFTLGGLGVWMLIDNIVIFVNCLAFSETIDAFGFHAAFDPWEVKWAFGISALAALVYLGSCCQTIAAKSSASDDGMGGDLP